MNYPWNEGLPPDPSLYDFHRDIPYSAGDPDDPMRTLWLSVPKGVLNFPVVVWIHGGGFAIDHHERHESLFNGRQAVVEIRHRIVPHVKAPAYLEDGAEAIAWVLRHIAVYGGDPTRVAVGGMSAGAYLAAIVCMDPAWLKPFGFGPRSIAGLALVSGQMTIHFQVKADLGYPGDRYRPVIDALAPLHHLSKDLPPILLVTGDPALDIPARAEENALAAATLRALGHPSVENYALDGHDHGDSFRSSERLVERFLEKIFAL